MEKKMSATKKLTIATISFAIALCFVIGGLIGIWAAIEQSVGSNFEVNYEVGTNVAAVVTAKYQREGDAIATPMGEGITFNVNDKNEGTAYDSLDATSPIQLTQDARYVIFTYTFKNIGSLDYTVKLEDTCTKSNVTVLYSSLDDLGEWKDVEVKAGAGEDVNGDGVIKESDGEIDAVEITIKVSIFNINKPASYTSTETNGIVWTLTSVSQA